MNKEIGTDPSRIFELRSAEVTKLRQRVEDLSNQGQLIKAARLQKTADKAAFHLEYFANQQVDLENEAVRPSLLSQRDKVEPEKPTRSKEELTERQEQILFLNIEPNEEKTNWRSPDENDILLQLYPELSGKDPKTEPEAFEPFVEPYYQELDASSKKFAAAWRKARGDESKLPQTYQEVLLRARGLLGDKLQVRDIVDILHVEEKYLGQKGFQHLMEKIGTPAKVPEPVPTPIKREISPEQMLKESMALIADAFYLRLDELDNYCHNANIPQFRNKFTSQNFKKQMTDISRSLNFRSWQFYRHYGFDKEVISQKRTEAFKLIADAIRGNELPEDLTLIPETETLVDFISRLNDEQLTDIQDIATKPNFAKPVVEPPFPSKFEGIRKYDPALDQNVEKALELIGQKASDTKSFNYRNLLNVFDIYHVQIVKGWDNGQIRWEQNSTDTNGLIWMMYDRIKSLPRFPDSLEQLKIFIDRAVYEDEQKKKESEKKQL